MLGPTWWPSNAGAKESRLNADVSTVQRTMETQPTLVKNVPREQHVKRLGTDPTRNIYTSRDSVPGSALIPYVTIRSHQAEVDAGGCLPRALWGCSGALLMPVDACMGIEEAEDLELLEDDKFVCDLGVIEVKINSDSLEVVRMVTFYSPINNGESNQYVIEWNMSRRYWSSGFWNGKTFSLVPELSYIYEFMFISNEHEAYFTYSILNNKIMSRLVMDKSGQLLQLTCMRGDRNWRLTSDQPQEKSKVYAICGAFGILNKTYLGAHCYCLQGFEESSANHCTRKTSLQCEHSNSSNGKRDGFLKMPNVKLPADSKAHPDHKSKKSCELECFRKCPCTAYAYNDDEGCSSWEGDLFGVEQLSDKDNNAHDLYLKLAASDIPKDGVDCSVRYNDEIEFIPQSGWDTAPGFDEDEGMEEMGTFLVLHIFLNTLIGLVIGLLGAKKCALLFEPNTGEKNSGKDLLSYDFNGSSNANDDETDIDNLRRGASKDVDLPFFSFASVSEATSNFSAENKLGEGGFGPVYKGKSLNGQEIALKRLSKRSGQGLEEFRNEIVLIAKLQHRNLVRLLGCSIEREESILIYEYMSNKSLDFFIFDPNNRELLDWETRICIIDGIAQGLLYLHHYSRLRIIHRDLKASNILLDSEMNPKISDFGMARIFGGNESQANTKRIVGTYGYMAPEYAMGGHFSIKSDVFSFGVLLLEIISGKKNTGFYQSESLNLLGHAWDLWISDKASELKDPSIAYPPTSRVLRYVNVGLLCVQENPTDRPTMSHVVSMLSNDVAALPTPRQPAFVASQGMNKKVSTNCGEIFSVNGLTVSSIEPR
ncbi:hypothetical protein LguiA_033831 [Lonicera macranthoides]